MDAILQYIKLVFFSSFSFSFIVSFQQNTSKTKREKTMNTIHNGISAHLSHEIKHSLNDLSNEHRTGWHWDHQILLLNSEQTQKQQKTHKKNGKNHKNVLVPQVN